MQALQQAALVEIGQAALAGTDLPTLMQQAVERVTSTLGVEYGKVLEWLSDGSTLVLRAGVGWEECAFGSATVGVGTTLPAGYTLLSGRPVIVDDWRTETRFGYSPLLGEHHVMSGLCVIIPGQSHPYGVLGVDSVLPRPFTADDVQFLQAVANLLAMAIERIQMEEALRASEARFRRLAENAADIIFRYHFAPTPGFDYVSPASTTITGYCPADYYADPQLALRLAHPEDRPQLEDAVQSTTAPTLPLVVRLLRRDGTLIWTEQRIVPLLDAGGALVGIEGIVRDITERVHDYQTLEQRVEERTREIESRRSVAEGLREILAILNSNRPLDEILDYIIAQACRLLGTPVGAIYRLNQQEGLLKLRASRGLDTDGATLNLPVHWDVISRAVVQRQPVVVGDGRTGTSPALCLRRLVNRYRALLIVPMVVKDDVYGVIALFYDDPRAFSQEEVRLATMLSDQAALAVENARLVVAVQGKAVLEERQRLARDLHDSVTQALYGITLYAEAGARLLASGDTATVAGHLRELQEMAQEALQEMRLLIFELRPSCLEEAGLVAALQTRLEAVEERSNLATTFVVEGITRFPMPLEQALYRIAQEALNNVLKHAHAHHVTVALRHAGPTVSLEITDDGVGFDLATGREQGGLGLRGIEERVAQLGGTLILKSGSGVGTQVRVELSV